MINATDLVEIANLFVLRSHLVGLMAVVDQAEANIYKDLEALKALVDTSIRAKLTPHFRPGQVVDIESQVGT